MRTRIWLVVVLGFLPQRESAAQLASADPPPATGVAAGAFCPGVRPGDQGDDRCGQLAAAARLRLRPQPRPSSGLVAPAGSIGKGALVGLGIGAGLGIVAALIAAPGCEENESRCTVVLIVGGGAIGAGIGAAVGAVVGKD